MTTNRPRGYEYKHLECAQIPALVDRVTNDHAKFFWEMTGTQTVVSKESHLESGNFNPDNLYSVTTTERFVALDFRRATDIQNLQRIKAIEGEYFEVCSSLRNLGASPLDGYSTPPAVDSFGMADLLGISALQQLRQPGMWGWMFTFGYVRYFKKIGVLGFLFPAYGYRKWKGGGELAQEQYKTLKTKLENLIGANKAILNVT